MAETFISRLNWSGASGGPTGDPATFSRDLEVSVAGVHVPMSAAAGYRGDASRANPEQLLVAALSACQALTYLYLAARHGLVVSGYADEAEGHLSLVEGRIRVSRVKLRPRITLGAGADEAKARELVDRAHHECFIANSVTARMEIEPHFEVAGP